MAATPHNARPSIKRPTGSQAGLFSARLRPAAKLACRLSHAPYDEATALGTRHQPETHPRRLTFTAVGFLTAPDRPLLRAPGAAREARWPRREGRGAAAWARARPPRAAHSRHGPARAAAGGRTAT